MVVDRNYHLGGALVNAQELAQDVASRYGTSDLWELRQALTEQAHMIYQKWQAQQAEMTDLQYLMDQTEYAMDDLRKEINALTSAIEEQEEAYA
jgi:peptidoglycan hydrolase CwlO-like protein